MTRFNRITVFGLGAILLAAQSCISAEDPKVPPQNSHSGTGGTVAAQGGTQASTGGQADTGGAEPGTGGDESTGGNESAGGEVATGGLQATGGRELTGGRQATGGLVSAEGGALPSTGGAVSAGGCDFGSTSCTVPCASYASSPASSWKQAPCEALLACLEEKASCITAADPLCGPKQAPSYAAPACGDDYYNAASDSDISTKLKAHIECICGF